MLNVDQKQQQRRRQIAMAKADPRPLYVIMVVSLAMLAAIMLARPVLADPSSSTQSAVRSVIEQQIQAFQRDDARGAYNYAAPSIQQKFPNADIFMDMVRRGYPPVYRPQEYDFGATVGDNQSVRQHVDIVGPNNELWTAVYTLQRDGQGDWLITGVHLAKQPGISS